MGAWNLPASAGFGGHPLAPQAAFAGEARSPPQPMTTKVQDKVASRIWSILEGRLFEVPSREGAFNFYRDEHPGLDLPGAARIRRENLRSYLEEVSVPPTTLVAAPAPGWRGARFTGVPFTSQLQLMRPDFPVGGRKTSKGTHLIGEKTGTYLWEALLPHHPEVFLWAVFPLHPHRRGEAQTNRIPTLNEIEAFVPLVSDLVEALEPERLLAVGRSAEWTLGQLDLEFTPLKHPAVGGLRAFKRGVADVFGAGGE